MSQEMLTADQAAQRLGIAVSTLYGWLACSDAGRFSLNGQPITIHYLQTGPKGQGRIRIEAAEVERLQAAMQVQPHPSRQRRPPAAPRHYPGISVPLGRPDD